MKRIVLCADDYGQEEAISKGILALLVKKRLTAVSCMVTEANWPYHAEQLLPFKDEVDIGLHLNLTEGKPLSTIFSTKINKRFLPLQSMMAKSFLGQLPIDAIAAELMNQLERFREAFGFLPRFIDGHQHVHQFPQIRDAVINLYLQNLKAGNAYIRWVNLKISGLRLDTFKKMMIRLTGTQAFGLLLKQHAIPHNTTFSGSYHFADAKFYPRYFQRFLAEVKDLGLIMCHPGLAQKTQKIARQFEYEYLASEKFLAICAASGINLARFPKK